MKTELFQSCGHFWVFQICWHIECSTFTASSFRIWNSSTGIPSPPLVLFIVTVSKAHLTSHSRMSGSRWVITPSWLSGSWRSCLYSSSVYSCDLFLVSSASLGLHIFSVVYCAHLCIKCSLGIYNFLEEISSFFHSILFLYFFALITEEDFLISPCYSLKLWIQMGMSFLFSFAFTSLLFTAICKASSDSHFAFLHFFLGGWSWSLPPVQCNEPPSIVLQALSLSNLITRIYVSLPLYNLKGFDLGHTWMVWWFSLLSSI